jgi:hypothetical protein
MRKRPAKNPIAMIGEPPNREVQFALTMMHESRELAGDSKLDMEIEITWR